MPPFVKIAYSLHTTSTLATSGPLCCNNLSVLLAVHLQLCLHACQLWGLGFATCSLHLEEGNGSFSGSFNSILMVVTLWPMVQDVEASSLFPCAFPPHNIPLPGSIVPSHTLDAALPVLDVVIA